LSSQHIELNPGELLVKSGAANHQRSVETVGGRLYLTSQRLVFRSHGTNVQRGVTEVPLKDIRLVETGWTKFLGFLPLVPNAVTVYADAGKQHRFTVFGRAAWADTIVSAMHKAHA
jgi:hypothetical protein